MKRVIMGSALAIAVGLGGMGIAAVIGEPDAAIKYRKDAMASVGGHIRAMVANLKGEIDDPAGLKAHAIALVSSTDPALLKTAFQQNTDGQGSVETTTTAKVWEDWNGFSEQIDLLNKAAVEIAALAEAGELTEFDQLKPALATCGACHRKLGYREKK
jgi:cytochrome c556